MEIDLRSIPVLQETVEICEYFDLNPYQIMSSGSMLMVAEDGAALKQALEAAGIRGTVVGKTTAGNSRILRNKDSVRYLDRPVSDELYKVMG